MTAAHDVVHPWVAEGRDRVRFAISTGVIPDPGAMRGHVQGLEALGFDAVFIPDHPALMGDPWLTLAAVADATTTIRLGVLVSCPAYRHPLMLARAAADVDRISGGRVVLGLGTGDMPHEFAMLGLDYGTPGSRRALLQQTLQVLPPLLRGEPVTFEGNGFALREAVLPMGAVQQPRVPILVAGGSRGTLRLVAAHADAINIGAVGWAGGAYTAADVSTKLAILDEFCTAAGRRPEQVLRTGYVGISIAASAAEARAHLDAIPAPLRAFFGDLFFAGTPDEVRSYLDTLVTAGFQYLTFVVADSFEGRSGMTEQLATDILPSIRATQPAH